MIIGILGNDRVMVETKDGRMAKDEIKSYVNGRYISGSESDWKIRQYPISYMYPSVQMLQFHLPEEQQIIFKEGDDLQKKAKRAERTMLTEFFKLNRTDEKANDLLYTEILRPSHVSYMPCLLDLGLTSMAEGSSSSVPLSDTSSTTSSTSSTRTSGSS